MAITWTKLIPRWGGDTIEPPEAKKDTGYIAGDKPPAKWENWLRKGTYEALDETRDVIEDIDSQLAQDVLNLVDHKAESSKKHIAESGRNPQGRYIKFDDGTMICESGFSISGTANTDVSYVWNFPAVFFDDSRRVFVTITSPGNTNNFILKKLFAGGFDINKSTVYLNSDTTQSYGISLFAVGRWK